MSTMSRAVSAIMTCMLAVGLSCVLLPSATAFASEKTPVGELAISSLEGDTLFELEVNPDNLSASLSNHGVSRGGMDQSGAVIINEISDEAMLGNLRVATFDVSVDLNSITAGADNSTEVDEGWINYWVRAYYQTQTTSSGLEQVKITSVTGHFQPATLNFYTFENSSLGAITGTKTWSYRPGGTQFSYVSMSKYTGLPWVGWVRPDLDNTYQAYANTRCLTPPYNIDGVDLSISVRIN